MGAGRTEDALEGHVLEFKNSLVAAAEGSRDLSAKRVNSDSYQPFWLKAILSKKK